MENYSCTSYSVTPIDDEVLALHTNARVFNDPDYYVRLAELYEAGYRVERNLKKAIHYYLKAVNIGSTKAAEKLALFYEYGAGKKSNGNLHKKSAKWWLKAAELRSQEGMLRTGYNYQYGIGLDKDHAKAFKWYHTLAKTGSKTGMFHTGECYFYGIGVEQDYAKAFNWYKKASHGILEACKKLSDCYALGLGTKQNPKQAKQMATLHLKLTQHYRDMYYL